MSPVAPPDLTQAALSASKKRSNKKKKSAAKGKANGDIAKVEGAGKNAETELEEDDAEAEETEPQGLKTPKEGQPIEKEIETHVNGHTTTSNGHVKPSATRSPIEYQASTQTKENLKDIVDSDDAEVSDASSRLEAMSQDREALRAEVEQLRKQLEDIQGKHTEELSTIQAQLSESEEEKEQARTQYQTLLGRVNTIKSTLGERMSTYRQELAEAKEQVEELEAQNESLKTSSQGLEKEVLRLGQETQDTSKELSSLRNRYNLSQQNWLSEREDLIQQSKHLREEADAAKEAMGEWEVLAMEERSIREGLAERVSELEDQTSGHKESYERAASERDSQSQVVDHLQRALQDIQETRKIELREMVESTQAQLEALDKLVQQAENRATEAETARDAVEKELERATLFEKEVKEKNLLIGKLRHEAIVLNEHLTKALRFLKKAKPEDNVDRQIVTNHFLHFLALDRSDPKKFQILQLIAALLNWSDEQREQAGLARPGASNSSLRLPSSPFYRTPSTPSLSTEFFPDSSSSSNKESLAELWQGFLERQAEEGSSAGSRNASVSGPPSRLDTRT
ncbi:MAG: hypothetical protein M1818_005398 [Claussenomyces sp. TS43310]|nr:MAG: hypothetical protein M1818_005398 [Claussenomyces sp. TS43310]